MDYLGNSIKQISCDSHIEEAKGEKKKGKKKKERKKKKKTGRSVNFYLRVTLINSPW
jgi:hypothetical protein